MRFSAGAVAGTQPITAARGAARRAAANDSGADVSRRKGDPTGLRHGGGPPPSDAELVRRARRGSADAFDRLVERYQRSATSVAYRLLGNLHDALEVCQEAFVRAYRNLEELGDPRRFRAWLLRIVTNLSLNYRRDRRAGPRRISLEDCLLHEPPAQARPLRRNGSANGHPGEDLAAEELGRLVQAALTELPAAQRLALVLFSIEQLPQKDVAAIMGCSVEAVKWHVFQARKRLRRRLAEHLRG